MPFWHAIKGGKHKKRKHDCSYENIDASDLPKLHILVLSEASTSKLKGFIAKKVSNINETDKRGRTALHYAASIGDERMLHILLQCGLTIDVEKTDDEGKTALFKAVEVFSPGGVQALLEHKAVIDTWDNHMSTPLHIATVNRKTDIVTLISNSNGNLNIKDKMGFTPLHVAAAFGFLEIATILIDRGADINSIDSLGRTPLMAAACEGTPKMVHLLIGCGADSAIKDNYNHTAVDHSRQNQSESMTKIIIEAVARKINSKSDSTELETASKSIEEVHRNENNKKTEHHARTNVPEIVISIDTVNGGDEVDKGAFHHAGNNSSSLEEIKEDVQEVKDVKFSEAVSTSFGDDCEAKKEDLESEDDALRKRKDRCIEPSSQLQEDSLNLLRKKKTNLKDTALENFPKKVNFSADFETGVKERKLMLIRNKRLIEENHRLKNQIADLINQSDLETEKKHRDLEMKKSELQFINLKNKSILEEKIKQCLKLELKLNEAHCHLIAEIEKVKKGTNLDEIMKGTIKELGEKQKLSDARIHRVMNQLKSSREENQLLQTKIHSLKGKISVLQEIISKKRAKDGLGSSLNTDEGDGEGMLRFYQEECARNSTENKTMQEHLNKLRMENAMLKEQHLSDKHEVQLMRNEVTEAEQQIMTLQYQLENAKSDTEPFVYRDILGDNQRRSIDGKKLLASDLLRSRNVSLERARSDSTLHGFRTFDSSVNMLVGDDYDYDDSRERVTKPHPADLAGM
eukprot:gene18859-20759_t